MTYKPSSIYNIRTKQGTNIEKIHYELNGIETEFYGSVKYFNEPDDDGVYPDGTWRIFVNPTNQLVRQRLESDVWTDYGADGSSTSFTDIILRGTEYGLYSEDTEGTYRPLVRTAFTDEKGVALGTKDGVFVVIHDGNALSWEPGSAFDTTRNDGTDTAEYTEYTEEVTPTASAFLDSFYYYVDSVVAGTKLRVSATSDSGNILYENVSEYGFSIGGGADVEAGANEFDLDPTAFRDVSGNAYDFKMEFSESVPLIGLLDGTFSAKIRTIGNVATENAVVLIPTWKHLYTQQSGSFTAGNLVYENNTVFICAVTGAQTTDFATNVNKWAYLGTVILSGGVFGGQTINGGLDNNEDLNLSSTADATKGNINLGANSTYDELNDRLGINTTTPEKSIDVVGDVRISGYTQLGTDTDCHPFKIKCFCGTLDSDSQTTVAHGVTATKIMSLSAMIYDGTDWYFGEFNNTPTTTRSVRLKFDSTNIIFDGVGTSFQGKEYRVSMMYIE